LLKDFIDKSTHSVIIISVSLDIKWVDLSQTIAIVTGFIITIYQLRKTEKITKFDIFWRIGDSHREVWRPILENKDLEGIIYSHSSIENKPITNKERFFVINIILHIENVHKAYLEGYYKLGENEKKDIGELFSSPIFNRIWDEIKEYQRRDFVGFIEGLKKRVPIKEVNQ